MESSADHCEIRRERAAQLLERLEDAYGRPTWTLARAPLDELVLTILSQHTSDTNCERAFASLRKAFPQWEQVVAATDDEIADAIRGGGLADTKAPRIKAAVREAIATNLPEMLPSLSLEQARARLQALPGVGPKTAACVLLFACGKPALPVDTHVHRVARRVGLIENGTPAERAHDELQAMLQPEDVYSFHINLIRHGREVCKARTPLCDRCVAASMCDFAIQHDILVSINEHH